jgi:type II secretory pathway component GspD/PulD (secretin)
MLAPQISDLGQLRKSPDGTEIPDTVTQYVQCLRTIKSGETMVLGGLTRKTETSSVNKVPILADLPIIGSLFRSKSSTREDSELLIFVTPVVLPDPDTGNQVSIEP